MTKAIQTIVVGMMQTPPYERMYESRKRVYSANGLCPACLVPTGGSQEIKVLVEL